MVLEGPFLSLSLLLSVLFLDSSMCKSQNKYRSFLRRHVDAHRTIMNHDIYCEQEMKSRGLTSPTCVRKHTFINALKQYVNLICTYGGVHMNTTLSDSLYSYLITICYFTGGFPPNDCKYRGQAMRQRLRLACFRGVPVGLEKILIIEY